MIATMCAIMMVVIFYPESAVKDYSDTRVVIGQSYSVPLDAVSLLPAQKKETTVSTHPASEWKKYTIKSGESLAIIFNRAGISPTTLHHLINTDKNTKSLSALNVGDQIHLGFDKKGKFVQLAQPINTNSTLVITKIDGKFISTYEAKEIDKQVNFSSAIIESSFWNAGVNANLTPNQIMEIAEIFGWDIDFALDIRRGDRFSVLFEEEVLEGEIIGRGKILAATFTNQGDTFTAIRSESGQYYDEHGRAMRKAFLRSPVNFRYVSSNFNPGRLHPVTGKVKAHRGTDYVAPVGTPIWAAGAGTVIASAYNKFNGNYVFIRHSSKYVTKYLHLSKRKVSKGQRVKQGQAIGTLGGTGRVTGPHLHYEFLVNGVHMNPRTVQLPQAKSLTGREKEAFMALAEARLEQLKKFSLLLASIGTSTFDHQS